MKDSNYTKKPKRHRQWLGKIGRKDKTRPETREVRQNFEKRNTRTYQDSPHGVATRLKHEKRRAKAKRSKLARKRNRR